MKLLMQKKRQEKRRPKKRSRLQRMQPMRRIPKKKMILVNIFSSGIIFANI